jgi:hypothetical protein
MNVRFEMPELWEPLARRLGALPLVLAGPILRNVDQESVTVWIALKEPATVTLTVVDTANGTVLSGTEHTEPVGEHLHVLAVTSKGGALQTGRIYFYSLWTAEHGSIDLTAFKLHSNESWPRLPSFCLPPADPWQVRVLHGSCRKLHGEGQDALAHIERVVATARGNPAPAIVSPHMLLLTGDQIYADDVADALLHMLIDTNNTLLAWKRPEVVEGLVASCEGDSLRPGMRAPVVEDNAGLTAIIGGVMEKAKSHLLFLGEYVAMYLFAWSDVLWGVGIPTRDQVFRNPEELTIEQCTRFDNECSRLATSRSALPAVRRAMANIPTYMIFDDHEVTDDWFLNHGWCKRVLEKRLGRRVITNALTAYAICQAWGNTPERFLQGQPGRKLLEAVAHLKERSDEEAPWAALRSVLRIPTWDGVHDLMGLGLPDPSIHLTWHFIIYGPIVEVDGVRAPRFAVLFLDTRTMRDFPGGRNGGSVDYAELIEENALNEQLKLLPQWLHIGDGCEFCLVVSAAPVLGVELMEQYLQPALSSSKAFEQLCKWDMEAWGFQPVAVDRLLDGLAKKTDISFDPEAVPQSSRRGRFLLLGGDVHYSFSFRMQYWRDSVGYDPASHAEIVFTQLTSSSLKNEDKMTRLVGSSLGTEAVVGFATNEPLTTKTQVLSGMTEMQIATVFGIDTLVSLRLLLLSVQHLAKSGGARVQPGLVWRVDALRDNRIAMETAWTPAKVPVPTSVNRQEALAGYLKIAGNAKEYLQQGGGRIIVGANNFGEVRFDYASASPGSPPDLLHSLWWGLKKEDDEGKRWVDLEPFPLTEHRIPIRFDTPQYPKPT